MWSRETALVVKFLAVVALFLAASILAAPAEAAQGTPLPKADAPQAAAGTPTETRAPAATRTPAPTPTPTATLTELQNRLLLADVYLKGGQYARAADIYSATLTQERGHPEALAGLKKALEGQGSVTATAAAPRPTPAPATPSAATTPSFASTLGSKTNEVVGTVLPVLLLVLALYFLALGFRWILFAVREFCYLRVFPFFHRPALGRPYLIGEFTDATGMQGFQGTKIVTQTLAEKLLEWNQLIQAKDLPIEPAPAIDLGNMSWIKVLWAWALPPQRAFKIEGVLLGDQPGAYRLAVRRTDLSTNSVDAGYTFESTKPVAEAAFQEMAGAVAKWAGHPRDIEASESAQRGLRAVRGADEAPPLSASEVYDEAVSLLLPVRQQINLGVVDHADARDRLRQAEDLLKDLPTGSGLYADLRAVITDLNRLLPA